jgi:hypothetical protein
MRFQDLAALLSLFLAAVLLFWTVPWKNAVPATRSVAWLDEADVQLFRHGLVHRHDVVIRVNDMDVARGYSRSGCDGLLLVAQLPNAAQGWNYVAPKLDLSNFEMRYVYKDEVYEKAPTLERLRGWLVGTLPGQFEARVLVVGLAETGHCHLIQRAVPVFSGTQPAVQHGHART